MTFEVAATMDNVITTLQITEMSFFNVTEATENLNKHHNPYIGYQSPFATWIHVTQEHKL